MEELTLLTLQVSNTIFHAFNVQDCRTSAAWETPRLTL